MKVFILIASFFLVSIATYGQDESEADVAAAESFRKEELKKERKYLDFKEAFMNALKYKATEDYDRALGFLDTCESLFPDNKSILFEKAKNLFRLERLEEAKAYCQKLLTKEPDYFWGMALLRDIYEKEHNYDEALKIENKLYLIDNTEAERLLRYYYIVKDKAAGKKLLKEIDQKNIYVATIDFYKRYFKANKVENPKSGEGILSQSKPLKKKPDAPLSSSNNYKEICKQLNNTLQKGDMTSLRALSENALGLFPAQALVYWYNAQAYIGLNKHQKAIDMLETGLDYIIDNPGLLKKFYNSLAKAYSGIHNSKKMQYYQNKAQKL